VRTGTVRSDQYTVCITSLQLAAGSIGREHRSVSWRRNAAGDRVSWNTPQVGRKDVLKRLLTPKAKICDDEIAASAAEFRFLAGSEKAATHAAPEPGRGAEMEGPMTGRSARLSRGSAT
jgi:hypothetical protein